ncbi:hypothetical protein ACFTQ7_14640 [Lysinibacillus sp. NPDC056959]|uniref:hypothetical protein n=1 Tax=Lysinibacillus sp. NPDC056959 TaxID=3345981 RepID=UPI003635F468
MKRKLVFKNPKIGSTLIFRCRKIAPGFICAKAKRQQQDFLCAKAKRQQQDFLCAKATIMPR